MAANILIVDDSATMRRMIRRTLELAGLDVAEIIEASNGIEAFAKLGQAHVDVIMLDINMPVMGGVQFMERIADDPKLSQIPIIIASTEGSETRIEKLVETGAKGYLRKPFRPEQVRSLLEPFVGVREQPAAALDDDDMSF